MCIRDRILMMSTKATHEVLEIGVISPEPVESRAPVSYTHLDVYKRQA